MKLRISEALDQLRVVNDGAIKDAGPRYTPGIDPGAPNIEIGYLLDAFNALSLVDGWRLRVQELAEQINKACEHQTHLLGRMFRRRRVTLFSLEEEVRVLRKINNPTVLRRVATQLRRNCGRVIERFQQEADALWEQLRALPDDDANRGQRGRVRSDIHVIGDVGAAVQEMIEYLDGPPGKFLLGKNNLLLVGSWGTGKTHLLCDMVSQSLKVDVPMLLVMASSLPAGSNLLDGIASSTGLAASGTELLDELERLGRATKTRALLIIDAINEGNQEAWRKQLPQLVRSVSQRIHVGLVVSCRRPFDEVIVTERAARRLVSLEHYGFQGQEFDAQLEYFSFYKLSAPSVPLITPEFTRPLFLKILCEGLKDLGSRSQQQKLREVASGQKGMTYVLEYYVKKIGREIEHDLQLPTKGCWLALKGSSADVGFAGRMAASGADWLSKDDALLSLQASLLLTHQQADEVLQRFIHGGLLTAAARREGPAVVSGVQFSYQRFGDHLIARHLLDMYLVKDTEWGLRHCFYRNRPLGAPFRLDQWKRQFEQPGIAAALMLEFPERMKRLPFSHELLSHLPKATKLVTPVKDVFLEGLYWRAANEFTEETDRLVHFFLNQADDWTRDETFEVLVGLATRPNHPYSATRLTSYLAGLTMSARDQTWSEYLRRADEQSNVRRILSWAERSTNRSESDARNEIRLLSLFLTTTNRSLRDRSTRALVERGAEHPEVLFDEVLRSLSFGDPYVPERMLAAAYGVAMRFWADPRGEGVRTAIVPFARALVKEIFIVNAPHATKHILQRGYALGVIALARKVDPRAISTRQQSLLDPPFEQIPSPFIDPVAIDEEAVEDCRQAMHMDFANYTIGRLVPDRSNYQEAHPGYQAVRLQIARRMSDLGYSAEYSDLDRSIAQMQPLSRESDGGKTDRYGKKYSWIAFFEMYGVRSDLNLLSDDRSRERPSDCDIDPSFPVAPKEWVPPLPDLFTKAPTGYADWLARGPVPNYKDLFVRSDINGLTGGPWVLIDGYVQQAGSHQRETFTFIRGLFMRRQDIADVEKVMSTLDYLGNSIIPEPGQDNYTYFGEIPWSLNYADDQRTANGSARRRVLPMLKRFESGRWVASGRVEIPVHTWLWESYHSVLNQISGIDFLAPALCEKLDLVNRADTFDLWDQFGRQASVFRTFNVADRSGVSHLLYLRKDLLKQYLELTRQVLVWIAWGERTLDYKLWEDGLGPTPVVDILQDHQNCFADLIEFADFSSNA